MAQKVKTLSDANNIPVSTDDQTGALLVEQSAGATSAKGTWTNRSGTITAGGTAQQGMAANTSRAAWFFQNLSTGDLYLSFVGTAVQTQPSVRVAPGQSVSGSGNFVSTQAMSVIGATTGQAYTLWEG